MNTKSTYLRHTTVLQDLSAKEIDDIGHGTRLVNYAAGHLFYMPDDPGEVMFILKKGRVQLYRRITLVCFALLLAACSRLYRLSRRTGNTEYRARNG